MQSPATGSVWPSMYSVLVTSSDEVGETEILVITNVTDERDDSISLMTSKHLESRRLWDVVLLAYNCSDNAVTDVIQLSKLTCDTCTTSSVYLIPSCLHVQFTQVHMKYKFWSLPITLVMS